MKSTQSRFSALSRIGFVSLTALGIGIKASLATSITPLKFSETLVNLESNQVAMKGQVVESGAYHFELVPEKSDKGFHLDLFVLTGDNHKPVPNAKVTGQVQLPDGKQKNLTFTYDTKDKHYTALLAEKASGQYQLKITADINGKKFNARFSFKESK
jgi:hypothetical protein